jgi:hypothetical protein
LTTAGEGSENKTSDGTLNNFLANQQRRKQGIKIGRNVKHELSLWKDETLVPRPLEAGENIFEIIMPWVKEQQADLAKLKDIEQEKKGPK